jgi:cytochrome c biogenesis protein CcmG, thiol:disulfide interchange protein DsbE
MASTLLYAQYSKKEVFKLVANYGEGGAILKNLPDFQAQAFDSDLLVHKGFFKNSSYKGFIFHFWATWCAPCEKELPDLIEFSRGYNRDILFVLIALKDDDKKIATHIEKYGMDLENFIVVHDRDGSITEKFGVQKVPESFFFSQKGLVNKRHLVGPQEWLDPELQSIFSFLTKP